MSTNVSNEDEMLPLSGLQHLAFCPRQWALIHLEQAWVENRLTAEGRLLHERVDLPGQSRRDTVRTVRGMWLECRRLRLTGRADVVEFRPQPYPLEYKRGKRKPNNCDTVQSARRPCAWSRCSRFRSRTAPSFTAIRAAGWRSRSPRSCESGPSNSARPCTACTTAGFLQVDDESRDEPGSEVSPTP